MTRVEMAEQTARIVFRYQATQRRGVTIYDDAETAAYGRLYRGQGSVADLEMVNAAVSREERAQGRSRRAG